MENTRPLATWRGGALSYPTPPYLGYSVDPLAAHPRPMASHRVRLCRCWYLFPALTPVHPSKPKAPVASLWHPFVLLLHPSLSLVGLEVLPYARRLPLCLCQFLPRRVVDIGQPVCLLTKDA